MLAILHLGLELFQIPPSLINCLGESARGWFTAILVAWCQVLPEERVVDMPTSVKLDQGGQVGLDGWAIGSTVLFVGIIDTINVCLMVLGMVELHRECEISANLFCLDSMEWIPADMTGMSHFDIVRQWGVSQWRSYLHDFAGDMRLESTIVVWQIRECVLCPDGCQTANGSDRWGL